MTDQSEVAESTPQPLPPHPSHRGAFGANGSGDTSGFGGLVRRVANPANLEAGTPRPYGSYFDDEILPPAFEQQPEEMSAFRAAVGAVAQRGKLLVDIESSRD